MDIRAGIAGQFWTSLLEDTNKWCNEDGRHSRYGVLNPSTIALFRKHLEASLEQAFADTANGGYVYLQNDYDPQGRLLEALVAAGVPCNGVMFSGDGLFPQKTRMYIYTHKIDVAKGYGGKAETIWKAEKDEGGT